MQIYKNLVLKMTRNKDGKITSLEIQNFLRSKISKMPQRMTLQHNQVISGHDSWFIDYQDLLQILMTFDDG